MKNHRIFKVKIKKEIRQENEILDIFIFFLFK